MASIVSANNKTNMASSIRGFGGLASGLDRDSLIEGMTAATRAKIAKQKQGRQTLLWKQEAYQSISSKLVEFSKKYTSYTSSATNLSSTNFWAKSNITANGVNSKYVSVTGSSSIADSMSIVGVKQLAKDANAISSKEVSTGILSTGDINLGSEPVSKLEGEYLVFKHGNKTYDVMLSEGTTSDGFTYDYSNGKKTVDSIKRALSDVSIGNGKTLADVIDVSSSSTNENEEAGTEFKLNFKSLDEAGNTLLLAGGSSAALNAIGFGNIKDMSDNERTISKDGLSDTILNKQDFFETKSFEERIGGKEITFAYNGTSKTINFSSKEKIEGYKIQYGGDEKSIMQKIANDMETELGKQFGAGRIKVGVQQSESGYQFTFETMTVGENSKPDKSSILSISTADKGILGRNGAMKVLSGASNRLNLDIPLSESGLGLFSDSKLALSAINSLGATSISDLKEKVANSDKFTPGQIDSINRAIDYFGGSEVTELKNKIEQYVSQENLSIKINGIEINDLTINSSVNDIINKINSSDAGVKITYMKNADKFSIQSTVNGAAGKIDISGNGAELIFGKAGVDYTVNSGQDAVVAVKFDKNQEPTEIVRGSNSFNLDGLNITVSGKFGYDSNNVIDENVESVTFTAKTNSDQIVTTVSDMIKDFNEIIKLVNEQVSTKPNRDYYPLTDEQKEEMTEDQIKRWEEKAKAGMLFNDSDLRSLSDSLRFIFEAGSDEKAKLSEFGISTSNDYTDKGKLIFDETKFRAALEKNPEDIKKLFTQTANTSTGEKDGFMAKLSAITNKFAGTTGATKGILIEKAGSTYAPTSILTNYLQKSVDSVDSYIKRLQTRLKTETDRYVKQFTNLENVISQMNSQSNWLSSFGG